MMMKNAFVVSTKTFYFLFFFFSSTNKSASKFNVIKSIKGRGGEDFCSLSLLKLLVKRETRHYISQIGITTRKVAFALSTKL